MQNAFQMYINVPCASRLQILVGTNLGVIVSNISITDDKTVKVNQIKCTVKISLNNDAMNSNEHIPNNKEEIHYNVHGMGAFKK